MISESSLQLLILIVTVIYFTGGVFHRKLIPCVNKKLLREKSDFIASTFGMTPDPQKSLPEVYFQEPEALMNMLPEEKKLECAANGIEYGALYFHEWNRIYVSTDFNGEDLLSHELVHYVWRTYGKEPADEEEKEREAWRMTRAIMRRFYPASYWILMIAYGFYGLWDYDFLKDSLFV